MHSKLNLPTWVLWLMLVHLMSTDTWIMLNVFDRLGYIDIHKEK